MKEYVIIAPHADDEIIGCYELLKKGLSKHVFFGSEKAREEAVISSELFGFSIHLFDEMPTSSSWIYVFPDPTYELHPDHRSYGSFGEDILRKYGYEVLFYSTNMNAPYIHEIPQPELKRRDLERCYSKKNSLWLYDHKYFLFEGYTKWIMEFDI